MCFWGKDCDRCAELKEDERNNSFVKECVECYKTMTDPTKSWMLASQLDHEGYGETEDGGGIICNLCAAEYNFDQQEIIYNYAKEHDVSLRQAAIYFDE